MALNLVSSGLKIVGSELWIAKMIRGKLPLKLVRRMVKL